MGEYFGNPVKAATATLQQEVAGVRTFTGGNSDTKFLIKGPGDASATVDATSAGQEYRIEAFQVSLSATATVTLFNATGSSAANRIWGPHSLAAGMYQFFFPIALKFGSAKLPYATVSTGNGTVEIQGYIAPTA